MENTPEDLAIIAQLDNAPDAVQQWLQHKQRATESLDGLPAAAVPPYPHALGEGNRGAHATPGESFAVLLPDAGALRAAELFTNDPCVDNTARIGEAGTRIPLPTIRPTCDPGHHIQFLARIGLNYFALEIPVWYRNP
jgi:hypothetical protein